MLIAISTLKAFIYFAWDNPHLLHEINQLIALHQVDFASDTTTLNFPAAPAAQAVQSRTQFLSRGMHLAIPKTLINGTYIDLLQVFIEHVQAHVDHFAFLTHPAVQFRKENVLPVPASPAFQLF